ncbi:hypothetical protein [Stenotrophomonas sp.]|uniref:hypothetical protein n=1 Tax=Stenotrophomonas sp. TaxID=69392 RepID=UPI002FC6F50D
MPVSPTSTTVPHPSRAVGREAGDAAPAKRHGVMCRLLTFLGIGNRPRGTEDARGGRAAVPPTGQPHHRPVPVAVRNLDSATSGPALPPPQSWAARAAARSMAAPHAARVPVMARLPVPAAAAPIDLAIDRHLNGQPAGSARGLATLGAANQAIAGGTRRAVALAEELCAWVAQDVREGRHGDASAFLGHEDGRLSGPEAAYLARGFDQLAANLADLGRHDHRLVMLTSHSMQGHLCHVLEGDRQARIFLHPAFHQRDIVDRAISLIHETSHHVLRTEDMHGYQGGHLFFDSAKAGAQPYQHAIADHLAQLTPEQARDEMHRNADSWANLAAVMALGGHRNALDRHIQADKAPAREASRQTASHQVLFTDAKPRTLRMPEGSVMHASAEDLFRAREGEAALKPAALLVQLQDAPWTTLGTAERKAFHEAAVSLAYKRGFIQKDALLASMDGLSDENVLERLNTLLPVLGLPRVEHRQR